MALNISKVSNICLHLCSENTYIEIIALRLT